jgi:hypothetical protein
VPFGAGTFVAEGTPTQVFFGASKVATSKGMVQVLGITYRIVVGVDVHHVVRLLDDRMVGSFRVCSGLEITSNEIELDALREVARTAARMGKVAWVEPECGWFRAFVRYWSPRRDARESAVAVLPESPAVARIRGQSRAC